jgi:hypothetical protein
MNNFQKRPEAPTVVVRRPEEESVLQALLAHVAQRRPSSLFFAE